MRVQRVDVAQDLTGFFKLLCVEHLGPHHETHGTACVHHIATDAAVQIFLSGNRPQHFSGHGIGDIARQHFFACDFELVVNAFKCVGRIFCIGIKQLEQHFLGIFDQAWRAPCSHAQQPKDWHIFVVDGEQYPLAFQVGVVLVQNEGATHGAWLVFVGN